MAHLAQIHSLLLQTRLCADVATHICEFLKPTFASNAEFRAGVRLWFEKRNACMRKYGHISDWNVFNITNMNSAFQYRTHFDEDLSRWDVGNVTDMGFMFCGAAAFNQPLNSWNVGQVRNMANMFYFATSFNQPLADWGVRQVQDMRAMFCGAESFNQPLADWDASQVQVMKGKLTLFSAIRRIIKRGTAHGPARDA